MTTTTTYVTVSRRDGDEVATLPTNRLAKTLIDRNRDAPPEVIEAVQGLADAIITGRPHHEYARDLGIEVRVSLTDAVDVGPAPAAPEWCLPGTKPTVEQLTKHLGGLTAWTWTRDIDGDYSGIWIAGEDLIIDGRIMRGAPRICMSEPPFDGWTAAESRQRAAALLNAADILDQFTD